MTAGWVVNIETSLMRELCRACRYVNGRWVEPSPLMLKGVVFFFRVGLLCLSDEKRVVGVMEEGLEGVSDNWLIGISNIYIYIYIYMIHFTIIYH